jgi:hypothetical protein
MCLLEWRLALRHRDFRVRFCSWGLTKLLVTVVVLPVLGESLISLKRLVVFLV